MRDLADIVGLELNEAGLLVAALEKLERLSAAGGGLLIVDLARLKMNLASWVASRVQSRADATTRPTQAPVVHSAGEGFVTCEEAAEMLGIAVDSARKACRTGRWRGTARKVRGRWMLPVEEVEGRGGAA